MPHIGGSDAAGVYRAMDTEGFRQITSGPKADSRLYDIDSSCLKHQGNRMISSQPGSWAADCNIDHVRKEGSVKHIDR